MLPLYAWDLLGGTFKWLLVGDDDTVFFRTPVKKALEEFDHTLPYFLSELLPSEPAAKVGCAHLPALPQQQHHVTTIAWLPLPATRCLPEAWAPQCDGCAMRAAMGRQVEVACLWRGRLDPQRWAGRATGQKAGGI